MKGYDLLKAMNGLDESIVRDAGIEKSSAKKKFPVRFLKTAAVVLLAAALLIPGGVYAYQKMIHSRTISYYLGDLDRIAEHRDALKAIVMENEALRLTVDAVLSDGHRTIILKTMESKTGEDNLPGYFLPALVQYTDGTAEDVLALLDAESLPYFGYADTASSQQETEDGNEVKILSVLDLDKHQIRADKPVKISYYYDGVFDRPGAAADMNEFIRKTVTRDASSLMAYKEDAGNLLKGFEFETAFPANVANVRLKNAEGDILYMSEFELYSEDGVLPVKDPAALYQNFRFITKYGQRVPLSSSSVSSLTRDTYFYFGQLADLSRISGVEIEGKEYFIEWE